jgi:hypothetical protein
VELLCLWSRGRQWVVCQCIVFVQKSAVCKSDTPYHARLTSYVQASLQETYQEWPQELGVCKAQELSDDPHKAEGFLALAQYELAVQRIRIA